MDSLTVAEGALCAAERAPLKTLEASPLFASVPLTLLARVLGQMEMRTYDAGAMLFDVGNEADALHLIVTGTVHLETPRGRTVTLPSPHCGEEALAGLPHYVCRAIAGTPVTTWRIGHEALGELAASHKRLTTDAALSLTSTLSDEPLLSPASARPSPTGPAGIGRSERIGWICAVLLPLTVGLAIFAAGPSVPTALFGAIMAVTVTLWVFSLVDEFIPPLLGLVACLFTGLAPPAVALSGFASGTLLTLLGVFALSAVMSSSGLTYRAMLVLLRAIPDRPAWQQTAMILGGYVLSPITPSGNNRLTLTLPLYRDMLEGLHLPRKGNAATALLAATFSGAVLFGPMMATSKSANLVAVALLPAQMQEQFVGLYWLLAATVAVLTSTVLNALALRWLIPAENPAPLDRDRLTSQLSLLGPMTSKEKVALAGFVAFLGGSATVSWHHVPAACIAGAILVALLVSGKLEKKDFKQGIDWPMIFFLLGIDGLVGVMRHLGIDDALGALAGAHLPSGGGLLGFIGLTLVVVLGVRVALPTTAGALVATVMLLPVAHAQNVHPWICIFLAAMFSDIWIAPYQSSMWMQVISQGLAADIDEARFLRHNMAMNVGRVAAALLSIPWWKWLGLA